MNSQDLQGIPAPELKAALLRQKAARRGAMTRATIPEKLRILEEMRDVTLAFKSVREQNRLRMAAFRAKPA